MKTTIAVAVLISLLNIVSCSKDNTDKKSQKYGTRESAQPAKVTEPAPNSPNTQDLHPDLHISGEESTHISGADLSSEHVSGQ